MENYQRIRSIGEGAFGKAWLVMDRREQKQFVIKEISTSRMPPKEREESRKEVAVLAQMNHPNIVKYRDSFEHNGTFNIVMEFCEGGDLYSKISHQRGVLFAEDQVLDWFVQISLALKHLHDRKILHRDIKSQNIFLKKDGRVKLGDFGIAKVLNSTMDLARTCIGTPYYLSPEICENKPYNNKSDIWALGCVLYEVATLKHAFEAGNMKNLVLKIIRGTYPPISPRYSYELRNMIGQLFKRNPRERPTINAVLRKPLLSRRIERFLTEEEASKEFCHTVMHGKRIARVLPSAARQRAPAARPLPQCPIRPSPSPTPAMRPIQRPSPSPSPSPRPAPVRAAAAAPFKRPSSGGSAGKRYDPAAVYGVDPRKRAKPSSPSPRAQTPEQRMKQQREDAVAKHQREMLEKQRRQIINQAREAGWKSVLSSSESESDSRSADGRPSPAPAAAAGEYRNYHEALDRMKEEQKDRNRQPDKAVYMDASPVSPREDARRAENAQALGAQAAERARLVEEFLQRKREAAKNRNRGISSPYSPAPVYNPPQQQRNRDQEEYLEKLRQIRMQNFHERRNMQEKLKNREGEDEVRRKKIEQLKMQAEERANRLKQQLEQKRVEAMNKEKERLRNMREDLAAKRAKDSSDDDRVLMPRRGPLPPDPTPVLHQGPSITSVMNQISPAGDSPSADQQTKKKKENILRRLNARKVEEPESRSQWEQREVDLGALPLEVTASQMEKSQAPQESPRKQWGGVGGTVMNALQQAELATATSLIQGSIDLPPDSPESSPGGGGKTVTLQRKGTFVKGKAPCPSEAANVESSTHEDPPPAPDVGEDPPPAPAVGGDPPPAPAVGEDPPPAPAVEDAKEEVSSSQISKAQGGVEPPTIDDPKDESEVNQLAEAALKSESEDVKPKILPKPDAPLRGKWQSPAEVVRQDGEGILFQKLELESDTATETVPDKMEVEDMEEVSEQKADANSQNEPKEEKKNDNEAKSESKETGKEEDAEEGGADEDEDEEMQSLQQSYQMALSKMEEEDEDGQGSSEDEKISVEDKKEEKEESQKDMRLGLTTGKFDVNNTSVLRTCSLPDLTKVFTTEKEGEGEIKKARSSEDHRSLVSSIEEEDEDEEEEEEGTEECLDEDEEVTEEEDDMLESVRQSMQTVLELPEEDTSTEGTNTVEDIFGASGELEGSGEWDDDDDEEFGDEDESGGGDVFLRLERMRSELEEAIGGRLLLEAYNIVQSMQEDEDDTVSESQKAVYEILGEEKKHYYDRIVQLVLADGAFMEDD